MQIVSTKFKSVFIWSLEDLSSSSAKKDSSNLVALTVQCGKHVSIVDLTSAIRLPAARNLSNLKGDVSHRKLVTMIYLNTIEEGGETEFLYLKKREKNLTFSIIDRCPASPAGVQPGHHEPLLPQPAPQCGADPAAGPSQTGRLREGFLLRPSS